MKQTILILLLVLALIAGFMAILGERRATEPRKPVVQIQPAPVEDTGQISLVVNGFRNTRGVANIYLYNLEENPDSAKGYIKGQSTISGEDVVFDFPNVPFGEYAIKVFHDENNNGRFDADQERESLGFSENIPAESGLKDISNAKFLLNAPKKMVSVQLY